MKTPRGYCQAIVLSFRPDRQKRNRRGTDRSEKIEMENGLCWERKEYCDNRVPEVSWLSWVARTLCYGWDCDGPSKPNSLFALQRPSPSILEQQCN